MAVTLPVWLSRSLAVIVLSSLSAGMSAHADILSYELVNATATFTDDHFNPISFTLAIDGTFSYDTIKLVAIGSDYYSVRAYSAGTH
jgi:hypothetical protein